MDADFDVVCAWSRETSQKLTSSMAVAHVRCVGDWSGPATKRSEIGSSYCAVSYPLLT